LASEVSTFRRVWIAVLVILGIALVLWLCWISLPVLPFLVGILLAYLLFPLVTWLERLLPPRGKSRRPSGSCRSLLCSSCSHCSSSFYHIYRCGYSQRSVALVNRALNS
jgi:predicted PurR-regulated permease PerM